MNILFDGNYLCFKSLSVFKQTIEAQKGCELTLTEVLTPLENQAKFFRKMIIDFCYTVREFNDVEKVFFAFDNPSWRKQISNTYKNKTKDDYHIALQKENECGQAIFYKVIDKFQKHVESVGFPTTRGFNFEGDDICYFYAIHHEMCNKDLLVVTGDKDCLQYLSNRVFVYRNNSQNPVIYTNGCQRFINIANKVGVKNKKLKIETVNPQKHLFTKIILGDDGDNVDKLIGGVGVKTADKLFENSGVILQTANFCNDDYVEDFTKYICSKVKNVEYDSLLVKVKNNILLMYLDFSVYPNEEEVVQIYSDIQLHTRRYSFQGKFEISDVLQTKMEL